MIESHKGLILQIQTKLEQLRNIYKNKTSPKKKNHRRYFRITTQKEEKSHKISDVSQESLSEIDFWEKLHV